MLCFYEWYSKCCKCREEFYFLECRERQHPEQKLQGRGSLKQDLESESDSTENIRNSHRYADGLVD